MDAAYTELSFLLDAAAKAGKSVYLHLEPFVWDITNPKSEKNLAVCTPDSRFTIPMGVDNLPFLFSALKYSILAEGRTVLGWDLKSLFSWFKCNLKHQELPKFKYFDLKYLEKYIGLELQKPLTFVEAQVRAASVTKQDNWTATTHMWKKVICPLAMTVVPAIENHGVINVERTARVYPCLEIDAQDNGRMTATGQFQWGINVHTMSDDLRGKLAPKGLDEIFLHFDYISMEVAVLQWLAQDENLGEILAGDGDAYVGIFNYLNIGKMENARKLSKMTFLPTIYGQSAAGLASKLGCPESFAQVVINRMHKQFAKSFRYVEQSQEDAKHGVARDCFGRKRFITEPFKARNFSIASPATAICLERLVALHHLNVAPILMSIHDGYVVSAAAKNATEVYAAVKECLQAESTLAPGLKLKVACKAGRNLREADMKHIMH